MTARIKTTGVRVNMAQTIIPVKYTVEMAYRGSEGGREGRKSGQVEGGREGGREGGAGGGGRERR